MHIQIICMVICHNMLCIRALLREVHWEGWGRRLYAGHDGYLISVTMRAEFCVLLAFLVNGIIWCHWVMRYQAKQAISWLCRSLSTFRTRDPSFATLQQSDVQYFTEVLGSHRVLTQSHELSKYNRCDEKSRLVESSETLKGLVGTS